MTQSHSDSGLALPSAVDALEAAKLFAKHRPRLFAIAWRMLQSRADADDVAQEAYLRWHRWGAQGIQSPLAFLITITTRLCLDKLRERKHERVRYSESELSEQPVEDCATSPEAQLELAEEVSAGFTAGLGRLGPEERTVFLMHDVFDYDYAEVAKVVGKAAPCCRQMVHRARVRVRQSQRRFVVTTKYRNRLLEKFLVAARTSDRQAVAMLLTDE